MENETNAVTENANTTGTTNTTSTVTQSVVTVEIKKVEKAEKKFERFNLTRIANIPAELKTPFITGDTTIYQWVCWRIEERDGRPTKVPVNPLTGSMASSTDSTTWTTFENAVAAYKNNPDYAGIGRTFYPDEHIVGIDFDNCVNEKGIITNEWVVGWVKRFNTYTEVSPSGTGIKLWLMGIKPTDKCRNEKLGIEIYEKGRYFTVTGNVCRKLSQKVEVRQEELAKFCEDVFQRKEARETKEPKPNNTGATSNPSNLGNPTKARVNDARNNGFSGCDKALLEKAFKAGNGKKFKNLWEGNYEDEGFLSNSEARMSLLIMLAFWTGGNAERMEQLYQTSALYKEKEEKLEKVRGKGMTFLQEQIETALDQWESTGSECYHPIETNGKPVVFLPSGSVTITESADEIGGLLAENRMVYRRGAPVRISITENGDAVIEEISPAKACSIFEKVARLCTYNAKGETIPTVASTEVAKKIIESDDFLSKLPPIKIITSCPVLVPNTAGELVEITGYDDASGIYAQGKPTIPCSLEEARTLINEVLADFNFVSLGDKSRAMAALLSPALAMGGLLTGRIPIDLCEADDSQAGKGFRNKITACIYGEKISVVNGTKGGIGGFDEALDSALMRGRPFISLDNIRGRIDSQKLESLLTETKYQARSAYRPFAEINSSSFILLMTSNKAELTVDLANRCSMVRIKKHPSAYNFKTYPEGDILDHVSANQGKYLGAVFAIIQAWWAAGKPESKAVEHDFRKWAKVMDWIMKNLMQQEIFLEDHKQIQQRVTSPAQNWLRDVALILPYNEMGNTGEIRTNEILKALEENGEIEIPGLGEYDDFENEDVRKRVLQGMGKRLAQCFPKGRDELDLGGISVHRKTKKERPAHSDGERDVKYYQFTRANKTCP